MQIGFVEVNVAGEFDKEGEPGTNINYYAHIESPNSSGNKLMS